MPRIYELPDRPKQSLFEVGESRPMANEADYVLVGSRAFNLDYALANLEIADEASRKLRHLKIDGDETIAQNIEDRRTYALSLAYAHFAEASGAYGQVERGEDFERVSKDTWNEFSSFQRAFFAYRHDRQAIHSKKRQAFHDLMKDQITLVELGAKQDLPTTSDEEAPKGNNLPSKKAGFSEARYSSTNELGPDGSLTTLGKLRALERDQRAGFLPTTHREKNMAIEILDYIDKETIDVNGRRIQGVENWLWEIYSRQANIGLRRLSKERQALEAESNPGDNISPVAILRSGKQVAKDTVNSLCNEWADYYSSASYSQSQLARLKEVMDNYGRPDMSICDTVKDIDTKVDLAPLIRYMDLAKFRTNGSLPEPFFDFLETKVNRSFEVLAPSVNKVVRDVYSDPASKQQLGDYFALRQTDIMVKDAKAAIPAAMADAQSRADFYNRLLSSINPASPFFKYVARHNINVA